MHNGRGRRSWLAASGRGPQHVVFSCSSSGMLAPIRAHGEDLDRVPLLGEARRFIGLIGGAHQQPELARHDAKREHTEDEDEADEETD